MNVLFYSPSCRFCSEAVRRASAIQQQQQQQAQGSDKLVLVSVDGIKTNLPPFVDRVPLLYTSDRQVLLEDKLMAFLDNLIAASSPLVSSACQGDPLAIEGGDTSSFSWLEQEQGGAACLSNPFESIGGDHQTPIGSMPATVRQQMRPQEMPQELPDHLKPMVVSRGRNSDRQVSMDAIIAARELEVSSLGGGGGHPWS